MLFLGGDLKRKEKLSDVGRHSEPALHRFHRIEGFETMPPQADLPLAQWALEDCLNRIQDAFYGVFGNFPSRIAPGKCVSCLPLGQGVHRPAIAVP